jgi:hypothetical protein
LDFAVEEICFADEVRHDACFGSAINLLGCPDLSDAPAFEHGHAIGN